jgi:hydroxymethylglutaryl-CoA lyase
MWKTLLSNTILTNTSRLMHSHTRTNSASYVKCSNTYKNVRDDEPNSPNIITPILFDVSLRDGIQGANPIAYPTSRKMYLFQSIYEKYLPRKIEIGSFVSPKVLPIMSDTAKLFDSIPEFIKDQTDLYALVPNKFGLSKAIDCGFSNFSFITSVSNAFQFKNTGKNLDQKCAELEDMMKMLKDRGIQAKTKIYISCVTECPLTGKIDNDYIIHEIVSRYGVTDIRTIPEYDEICISDTMGTLRSGDFEYIVDGLIRFGVAPSRISIHLHINRTNKEDSRQILFACFRRKINRFDVSFISEGGCSVTMDTTQLKPNMTYEFLRESIEEYYAL